MDNLIAEFHIRYGGFGGVTYPHIADNYIALFSRFVPCGVWEAVYIQSFPVLGSVRLFGFELLPRIRNFRALTFHRPEPGMRNRHIDALFGEPIHWQLIEDR
ncbi:Tn3 family transposase [Nonomuraea sp. CA-141351]|uniref:Tn3 family transposase n=1 Tax=Nonomuraea sp. CA-141351 TaxID=3239996 RepID=UPI003D92798C